MGRSHTHSAYKFLSSRVSKTPIEREMSFCSTTKRTSSSKRITDHGEACKNISKVEFVESKHFPAGEEAECDDEHAHAVLGPHFGEQSRERGRGHLHAGVVVFVVVVVFGVASFCSCQMAMLGHYSMLGERKTRPSSVLSTAAEAWWIRIIGLND
jgi:hypothetical protein